MPRFNTQLALFRPEGASLSWLTPREESDIFDGNQPYFITRTGDATWPYTGPGIGFLTRDGRRPGDPVSRLFEFRSPDVFGKDSFTYLHAAIGQMLRINLTNQTDDTLIVEYTARVVEVNRGIHGATPAFYNPDSSGLLSFNGVLGTSVFVLVATENPTPVLRKRRNFREAFDDYNSILQTPNYVVGIDNLNVAESMGFSIALEIEDNSEVIDPVDPNAVRGGVISRSLTGLARYDSRITGGLRTRFNNDIYQLQYIEEVERFRTLRLTFTNQVTRVF